MGATTFARVSVWTRHERGCTKRLNFELAAGERASKRAIKRSARTLWLVADLTSASIDIAAKPDEIMAVIADFGHYPIIDGALEGLKKRVEG